MAKDSYWFRHDSNASRDLKLVRIRSMHGWEGVGIFWGIIEILREHKNYQVDFSDGGKRDLSYALNLESVRLNSIIFDMIKIGLFQEKNGILFSESLINRMKEWEKQKKNGKKGGRKKEPKPEPNHQPKSKPNGGKRGEEKREEETGVLVMTQHPLRLWISQNLKNVSKLPEQLTESEAESLLQKFDRTIIREVLEQMENKKDLLKKYTSVNLTIQSWIRVRAKDNVLNSDTIPDGTGN